MLLLVDTSGGIRYANPAATNVLGYGPADLLGRTVFELVLPEEQESYLTSFSTILDKPQQSSTTLVRVRHDSGSHRLIESAVLNLLDDPRVAAILINWRDVTHRFETAEGVNRRVQDEARLGGVLLAIRALANLMNNNLAAAMAAVELVQYRLDSSSDPRQRLQDALHYLDAATETIAKFQRVVRVETKDTIVGPVLDLDRSIE